MIATERSGEHFAECNGCGETEYSGTMDFKEFVDWLKQQGWKISKGDDDEWCHECPECRA